MATAVIRNTLSSSPSSSSSSSSPASSVSASSNDDSFVTAGTSGASTRTHNQQKTQTIASKMYAAKLLQAEQQPAVATVNDDTDDDGDTDEDTDESMDDRAEPVGSIVAQLKGAHIRDSTAAAQSSSKVVNRSDSTDYDEEDEENEEVSEEESVDEDEVEAEKVYGLDDFQIIRTIGTGTFGRVCLCRDKDTDTYCAMKILAMADVIRLKQVEHVKNEKNILFEISHPFIVNLRWFTRDDCCLYMLFDYVVGGELFSYLRNAGRFSTATANFYACEIVLALEYLHSHSIVYRDLKPENLLIDRDGHLKITDFGFAKKLKDRTWTLCGTPEYLAPEIIQSKGHNRAVDWWALGVLIYEMLVGYPPFYDDNPFGIYEKILGGKIDWPRHMDPIAKDLVKKLLVPDRTKRLGNMKNGAEDVKRHRWFKHLDWTDVLTKKLTPPVVPKVQFDGDTSNFDEYPETDWKAARLLDKIELQLFDNF